MMKKVFYAIREGFAICSRKGYKPGREKSNRLYTLPLWIGIPIAGKIYQHESLCQMFDGHTQHAPIEIKSMLQDLIQSGQELNLPIPYLTELYKVAFKE